MSASDGFQTEGQRLSAEGDDLAAGGRLEEALRMYDRALAADVAAHGGDEHHPEVAARYSSIGGLYRAAGDDEAAHDYFSKALEVELSSGTSGERVAMASYLSNVAGIERSMGRVDAALYMYNGALDHLREVLPEDVPGAIVAEEEEMDRTPRVQAGPPQGVKVLGESGALDAAASVLNNLGLLLKSTGYPRCAYRLYSRAVSLGAIALGEHHPSIAVRVRNLGAVLLGLGHVEAAVERLTEAQRMCALGYGEDHSETAAAVGWLQAARDGADAGRLAQEGASAEEERGVLSEAAEWFLTELDCGVLEPLLPPPITGDDANELGLTGPARIRALPPLIPAAPAPPSESPPPALPPAPAAASPEVHEQLLSSLEAHDDELPLVPVRSPSLVPAFPLRENFVPLEPAAGDDLLAPYAEPKTAIVGGDDSAGVWQSVAAERADIVSNRSAMPADQDYIDAYLRQAPGYADLFTPFHEMPPELLIPYADYRGYGVPRLAKELRTPRLAGYHEPRVHSPAGYNKAKASSLGYVPVPRMGLGTESSEVEALIADEMGREEEGEGLDGGTTAVEAVDPE